MKATPITLRTASEFISRFHRHHKPSRGWKFGVGAEKNGKLVGVVVVGRPIARMLDNGKTAEVLRLCTDGSKNACSFLYSVARKIALTMGYERVITYILESESGSSLKASGWRRLGLAGGGSWSRTSRKRIDKAPIERKQIWEAS